MTKSRRAWVALPSPAHALPDSSLPEKSSGGNVSASRCVTAPPTRNYDDAGRGRPPSRCVRDEVINLRNEAELRCGKQRNRRESSELSKWAQPHMDLWPLQHHRSALSQTRF